MSEPWSWCEGNGCPVVVAFCYSIEDRTCGRQASVGSWSCKLRNQWHALFVCVVLNSVIWLASSKGIPLVHCNEYEGSVGLQCYPRCEFLLLVAYSVCHISELLASYFWRSLLYPLNCVPVTGVFFRFVAVDNTNLAAVRTSAVRMASVSIKYTEVDAGGTMQESWQWLNLRLVKRNPVAYCVVSSFTSAIIVGVAENITGTKDTEVVWRSHCSSSTRIVSADTNFIFLCFQ